jgi:hypothetical protein
MGNIGGDMCHPQASEEIDECAMLLSEKKDLIQSPATYRMINVNDVTGNGPLNNKWGNLPAQLRGVFWLEDQGHQSTLMSFGGPTPDSAAGFSTGQIDPNGCYATRLTGEGVWCFGDKEHGAHAEKGHDKAYVWQFDDAEDPKFAEICMYNAFTEKWMDFREIPGWAVRFTMRIMTSEESGYDNSVCWKRVSTFLNDQPFRCCTCLECMTYCYQLTQVIDEHGKRLEPAWSDMVAHMEENCIPSGAIYYRSKEEYVPAIHG